MRDRIWHKNVIPKSAEEVLAIVNRTGLSAFYLAGGTALALQVGHRISRDLDFFSEQAFDEEKVLSKLREIEKLSLVAKGEETLHVHVSNVKVSFLGYHYPLLFPLESFLGVQVADPREIACMKISAIAGRGARRDFVDLYIVAKEYGLAHVIDLFKQKYARINFNLVHAFKSLTYFKDAETEPMPQMLAEISWDEITDFFRTETPKLLC